MLGAAALGAAGAAPMLGAAGAAGAAPTLGAPPRAESLRCAKLAVGAASGNIRAIAAALLKILRLVIVDSI
jgi:hypothetical protein